MFYPNRAVSSVMSKVLSTCVLPGSDFELLKRSVDLQFWPGRGVPDSAWLEANIGDKDALIVTLSNRVDRKLIDAGHKLKVIGTYSVGYDHIDVRYARERKIRVTYTPDVLTGATADLIFGLLLAVSRRIAEGDAFIRSGRWTEPWQPDFMLGHEVNGKTIGIVGAGRIGRAVAGRASGFDMNVLYNSRSPKQDFMGKFADLNTLLSMSDFVVLAVSLNTETFHLMNEERLNRMKAGSFLINASRGGVVDEGALFKALTEGRIGGAALDVFSTEPLGSAGIFGNLKNVVLTPHIGSATFETREKMTEVLVRDVLAVLNGSSPAHEVK
jgi:glyoxylate reductase